MVTRVENYLEFDIYRKPTNTERCILSNSYHSVKTKLVAYNSYYYRAVNIRMNEDNFNKEIETIRKIRMINGYSANIVNSLIKEHQKRNESKNLTSIYLITPHELTKVLKKYW